MIRSPARAAARPPVWSPRRPRPGPPGLPPTSQITALRLFVVETWGGAPAITDLAFRTSSGGPALTGTPIASSEQAGATAAMAFDADSLTWWSPIAGDAASWIGLELDTPINAGTFTEVSQRFPAIEAGYRDGSLRQYRIDARVGQGAWGTIYTPPIQTPAEPGEARTLPPPPAGPLGTPTLVGTYTAAGDITSPQALATPAGSQADDTFIVIGRGNSTSAITVSSTAGSPTLRGSNDATNAVSVASQVRAYQRGASAPAFQAASGAPANGLFIAGFIVRGLSKTATAFESEAASGGDGTVVPTFGAVSSNGANRLVLAITGLRNGNTPPAAVEAGWTRVMDHVGVGGTGTRIVVDARVVGAGPVVMPVHYHTPPTSWTTHAIVLAPENA